MEVSDRYSCGWCGNYVIDWVLKFDFFKFLIIVFEVFYNFGIG